MFFTTYNKEEKLWCGPHVPPLFNPQISIAQALLDSMSTFGSKVAQISDNNGIRMTFDEIRIKTIRAAQNLQALGYKPKDVFTLIARNSHHVAPITFASLAIGCPLNTLDPSFGRAELNRMMKITNTVLVFCDVECFELVDKCLKELGNSAKIFTFGDSAGRSESVESLFEDTHRENQFIPVQVNGSTDTALITCSSGTTGLPKGTLVGATTAIIEWLFKEFNGRNVLIKIQRKLGSGNRFLRRPLFLRLICVCLSHAAILDAMSRHALDSSHVMLCFSSLYWISGVITLMRGTLIGALRIITTEIFAPELLIDLIERYEVTFTLNAPHQLVLMMNCDRFKSANFSSLKYVLVGGSKVPFYLKTELSKYCPNGYVHAAYGASETVGPWVFDYPAKLGKDSVGMMMGGHSVKITDDTGNRCGPNVDGEICVKMTYKFLGYYGNPEATADLFDQEGFIVTGDMGHFDEDGDLFVTGRKKDLLKYYNFPIAPTEIDEYLVQSPDIASACVVGIPDPMGDLPAAVIVRNVGSTISEKEVFNMVAGHFADHYKLRGGVYFVDSLPTTPSGKVVRKQVKEIVIEQLNSR